MQLIHRVDAIAGKPAPTFDRRSIPVQCRVLLSSIKYGADPLLNQSVFHELSSFEAYTELYPNALNARSVSELLLLRSDVPRSLHACIEELSHILADLPGSYGRTAQRLAAEFEARLRYTGIDEILEDGLHSRLTEFIEAIRELARAVQSSYLEVVCGPPSYKAMEGAEGDLL